VITGAGAAAVKAASSTEAASTVKAAATMEAASSTAVAASMLGKSRRGCADESYGGDSCKKSLRQGGVHHFNPFHLTALAARLGGQAALANAILSPIQL
jgi:hypothetical protein